jgi:hypothetical protein
MIFRLNLTAENEINRALKSLNLLDKIEAKNFILKYNKILQLRPIKFGIISNLPRAF